MPSTLAPIAVFAFKRPEHLSKMFDSLSKCALAEDSEIFVFCDAARAPDEEVLVNQTRAVARGQHWCNRLEVVERPNNFGLSKSIVDGVGRLCEEFGRVIVLEDDLVLAPSFLEYMNEALKRYENDERVMQIAGYNYPVHVATPHDAFFLVHSACWGWGTWQRAWRHFGEDSKAVARLRADRRMRRSFDMEDSFPYFAMLERQLRGEIDSWGVVWYLNVFIRRGLVLMPKRTLVENIGQDGTGTNMTKALYQDRISGFCVHDFPPVEESRSAYEALCAYFRSLKCSWLRRTMNNILGKMG